jgi:hypothetical protein
MGELLLTHQIVGVALTKMYFFQMLRLLRWRFA